MCLQMHKWKTPKCHSFYYRPDEKSFLDPLEITPGTENQAAKAPSFEPGMIKHINIIKQYMCMVMVKK